jgi:Fur family iron response transcriptional regulator
MDHGKDPGRFQELLEQRGIQATAQRLRIAELLFARDQHLTAEQILEALAEDGSQVSKATVYNTLNLFAEKGLLKPLLVDPERGLFDSNTRPHYHIHVEDTGELIDVHGIGGRGCRHPGAPAGFLTRCPLPGACLYFAPRCRCSSVGRAVAS